MKIARLIAHPLKFTIRDLLWLTVVVGLGVGWTMDRHQYAADMVRGVDFHVVGNNFLVLEHCEAPSCRFAVNSGFLWCDRFGQLRWGADAQQLRVSPVTSVPLDCSTFQIRPDGRVECRFWDDQLLAQVGQLCVVNIPADDAIRKGKLPILLPSGTQGIDIIGDTSNEPIFVTAAAMRKLR